MFLLSWHYYYWHYCNPPRLVSNVKNVLLCKLRRAGEHSFTAIFISTIDRERLFLSLYANLNIDGAKKVSHSNATMMHFIFTACCWNLEPINTGSLRAYFLQFIFMLAKLGSHMESKASVIATFSKKKKQES
jgi:hypothetical protein